MKKLLTALLACAFIFTGCGSKTDDSKTIKVMCTVDPHSIILEEAKDLLADKGYTLEISTTDNYYIPNEAVSNGEIDANYFQHVIFFENEKNSHDYKIANAGSIHLEPFGLYSKTITKIDDLKNGATVIISNSVADHGRILSLLETAGLITLKEGIVKSEATQKDVIANPLNLTFKEVAPELLTTTFENGEGDLVAINGNYALQGGLNPIKDAVVLESSDNNPYVNIVACQEGHENDEKITALVDVLTSEEIQSFIETKYEGSVIVAK